jgi:hypothetical protein
MFPRTGALPTRTRRRIPQSQRNRAPPKTRGYPSPHRLRALKQNRRMYLPIKLPLISTFRKITRKENVPRAT